MLQLSENDVPKLSWMSQNSVNQLRSPRSNCPSLVRERKNELNNTLRNSENSRNIKLVTHVHELQPPPPRVGKGTPLCG